MSLDFDRVRLAVNSKWNTEILEARGGIGGHCLPKDVQYVISMSPNAQILKEAVKVDKKYRERLNTRKTQTTPG